MEAENVFKIASKVSTVREFLTRNGWEFRGKDEETEMDSFRKVKTRHEVFVLDISEDFPVTFLMGALTSAEFGDMADELTPEIKLLEVDSSWDGMPTTVVVAMTEGQVRKVFGSRTRMRPLPVRRAVPQA